MRNGVKEIIFTILLLTTISELNAECCRSKKIEYICSNSFQLFTKYCQANICMDGTELRINDFHCGKGQCNMFGCNCDKGCRNNTSNTWEEAKNLYASQRSLKNSEVLLMKENYEF